jgi:phage shock protein PspC (stress-responsive transcriptional regulator)
MDNASPATDSEPQATPPPGPQSGPRVSREEMKDLGRLRRSVTDRHIAGVAGGLARHLDVDPIIVRVALVVSVFFGGAGLLAYVGAWILVPEEGTSDEPLGLDRRSRTLALAGVGVLAVLLAVGDWAGAFWFPWPLAIVAAVVVWFLHHKEKDRPKRPKTGYGYAEPAFTQAAAATAPATPAEGSDVTQPFTSGTAESTSTDMPTATPTDAPAPAPYAPSAGGYDGSYSWVPPTSYAAPRPPRNPRKRGPILFGFTLALIALAEGVLGVVDLSGVDVAGSAYPALALGITALMLVVGSFWGRAGGLIALGLVAALGTAAATVGDNFDAGDRSYFPTRAVDVRDSYDFGGGNFVLDLSGVTDVDALDGHDITIDGVGGTIEVTLPQGMDVDVTTEVIGGNAVVLGERSDGFDITQDGFLDGGVGVPEMTLNIDLVGGEILVREAS